MDMNRDGVEGSWPAWRLVQNQHNLKQHSSSSIRHFAMTTGQTAADWLLVGSKGHIHTHLVACTIDGGSSTVGGAGGGGCPALGWWAGK